MLDLGLLWLPVLGATGVIVLAFLTAEELAIDSIHVPPTLEWNGYSEIVITQLLTDSMREINDEALELQLGVDVDPSRFETSLSQFEQYFGLAELVTGLRELTGSIQYYVSGEITEEERKLVFTARVFTEDVDAAVHVVRSEGDLATLNAMLHQGALRILEQIDPYIVAVHYHEEELGAGKYGFELTREKLEKFVLTPPPENNYLAYDLIGLMHLERAKCDRLLSEEDRAAQRRTALVWLGLALDVEPDYLLTNLHLADAYFQLGDFERADEYYARAVGINPNNRRVRERWGSALAEQGRVREAIFQYVAAVEIDRASTDLRKALSKLYSEAGYPEAAEAQYRKGLLIHPGMVDPNIAIGPEHQPRRCGL